MPKRNLRIVNPGDPLFCVCEACSASFKSTSPESARAEQEVKAQSTRTNAVLVGGSGLEICC
ncbi:MAG: hypothetical protein DMG76_24040 [Acidobacteria bacterium]|nr:MAG: hypothetical protein DMG76_24040 [Acidobacteriota bacterium]